MERTHRTAAKTRDHVLRVARDLFYWQGIRVTGVDTIASEAGVAPMTLYRVFGSKDDLVAAYVEREAGHYREWLDEAAGKPGAHPRDRILALFDALTEQVQPHQCRGCPFLMALAEFPDAAHPAHRHAVELKRWVRARIGELTAELAATTGLRDPAALADQLALVMEGVYASVQALGVTGPAGRARALVEQLLAAAERAEGQDTGGSLGDEDRGE